MALSGGRSSERLIEELSVYTPGRALFALSPIHAAHDQDGRYEPPGRPPVTIDGLESVLHEEESQLMRMMAYYPKSKQHLALELIPGMQGSRFHWHLEPSQAAAERAPGSDSGNSAPNIKLVYLCSVTASKLTVTISPSILQTEELAYFYNEEGKGVFARALRDLLSGNGRPIRASNSLVIRSFDCRILQLAGFSFDQDSDYFYPPSLTDLTLENKLNLYSTLLEVSPQTVNAIPKIARFLSVSEPPQPGLSNSHYGTLGAVSSFSDEALLESYTLQSTNDPPGIPWYLEALKQLAQSRRTYVLETRVLELMSLGTPTLGAVVDALRKLGLEYENLDETSDEKLLELHWSAAKPLTEQEMELLAQFRRSQLLSLAAAAASFGYDDAFRVLGFIPENDTNVSAQQLATAARKLANTSILGKIQAREALTILGSVQKSAVIFCALEELSPPGPRLSLSESYATLGASSSMEDSDVAAVFDIAVEDGSFSPLQLRNALRVIADDRESNLLHRHLDPDLPVCDDEMAIEIELPVGLWNIGNTCYLNSVLQFYYTIQRVRDLAASFATSDNAQKDDGSMAAKKVGGRLVPFREVHRAQVFVSALGRLYREMSSSRGQVWPPETLAYMALVPPQEDTEEELKMLETLSGEHNKVSDADKQEDAAIAMEAETESGNALSTAVIDLTENVDSGNSSNTSEAATSTEQQLPTVEQVNQKGSNEPNEPSGSEEPSDTLVVDSPAQVQENGVIKELGPATAKSSETESATGNVHTKNGHSEIIDLAGEEAHESASALAREKLMMALARQQDVTECIENVLFQLEAAVKAEGYDSEDGEQLDLIKDLFYGTQVQTLTRLENGAIRNKKERFSSILVDVSEGPTDVYQALDKYFSRDVLDLGGEGPDGGVTERSVSLQHPPAILQLQVQRVQFNRQTLAPFKSLHPLTFGNTVYLDRYLDPNGSDINPDLKHHIIEAREIKDQLICMEKQDETDRANSQTYQEVISWYKKYNVLISEETKLILHNELESIVSRIKTRTKDRDHLELRLDTMFDKFQDHGYKPHALFIHKGNVNFGHYWIYILSEATGKWFKYNDEIVTQVKETEVLDFREGNLATPYFIVFKSTKLTA